METNSRPAAVDRTMLDKYYVVAYLNIIFNIIYLFPVVTNGP